MDADDTMISDSEPESSLPVSSGQLGGNAFLARAMREAEKAEREKKTRQFNAAGMGAFAKGRNGGKDGKKEEVLVLSSDGEEEGTPPPSKKSETSRYFASTGGGDGSGSASGEGSNKRRRVPSAVPAGEGWPSLSSVRPRTTIASSSGSSSSVRSQHVPPIAADTTSASATKSTPFVSALDLLRTTPTQPSSSSDGEEDSPGPKKKKKGKKAAAPKPQSTRRAKAPTVKKPSSASASTKFKKRRSESTSSVEIVEKEAGDDEDDRMSVSSASSSTSASGLPAPSSWKERFAFGAKGSNDSLFGSGLTGEVGKKLERSASSSLAGGGAKKMPWEAMESTLAKYAPRTTRASSSTATTAAKKVVKVEAASEHDHNPAASDSDDLLVLSPSSTVLRPLPSASFSRSSSSSLKSVKKPSSFSTSFLPPPLTLPHPDRLRPLTSCPLCSTSWASSKPLTSRQTHLRSCASKNAFTSPVLSFLVDEAILRLASEAEDRRREREASLSLFDRTVGVGEGAGGWREVTAVGLEEAVEGHGGEYFRKTVGVQEELDRGRRKWGVEKVVKVAREVRRERAAAEQAEAQGEGVKKEAGGEEGGEGVAFPQATGRLKPDSEEARQVLRGRAEAMLGVAGGSGLTQPPSRVDAPGRDGRVKVEEGDEKLEDDELHAAPPRPTQAFEPSSLARRCEKDGTAEVVLLPSRLVDKAKQDGGESSEDEEDFLGRKKKRSGSETGSLWKSAAGREEEDGSLASSPSPFSSPSRRDSPVASTLLPAFVPTPPTGISPSTSHRFSTLTLTSPPSSFNPLRPRSRSSPSRARDASHPYLPSSPLSSSPLSRRNFSSASASASGSPLPSSAARPASRPPHQRQRSVNSGLGSGLSPRTEETTKEIGRLGLSEHRVEEEEYGFEGGAEGWGDGGEEVRMLKGGASPARSPTCSRVSRSGGRDEREEVKEEDSSEDEPLAVTTSRARRTASKNSKTTKAAATAAPFSPTPSATRIQKNTTTTITKSSAKARRRNSPPPLSDSGESETFVFSLPSSPSLSSASSTLPTPPRPRGRPPKIASTFKPSTAAPPAADFNPALRERSDLPSYAHLSLAQLQKEVGKFGFRPSKERGVMEEQLRKVWVALNPEPLLAPAPLPPPAKEKKGRGKKMVQEQDGEGEEGGGKGKGRKPRKRKKAAQRGEEGEEGEVEEEEDTRTAGEKLRALIVAEEGLYVRVLRYEPIHLDEFTALIKRNGVKIAQTLLMRCLDEQSVTFYTQDPTNGQRRRYK
ncbi:hypothetical protein JCM8547_008302 [Rhodosporidiobolus lusitaniae]